jgi:alpha-L-fucosidase
MPPTRYDTTWESLDSRPNPGWFARDKIGIFIHWGVYSVPGFAMVYPDKRYGYGGHSCWYGSHISGLKPLIDSEQAKLQAFHRRCFGGDPSFEEIAPLFRAELFDPAQWAALFARAGARWAILTSNFHDGYCLWPSPYSPHWNSVDVGPKRDLLGEFTEAMRAAGLRAGFYYSVLEHNHPLYPLPAGKKPEGDLQRFVREHMQPQLREAVRRYQPAFIYLDGEWEFPADDLEMRDFLVWLYNEAPNKDEVVINDRLGLGSRGRHGGVYCSEIGIEESGTGHAWIEDRPLSRGNWSRNRAETLDDYLTERDLLHLLAGTLARGGNIHFDLSPGADGAIPMIQQERLVQLGDWLAVNGEAVYGSRRWSATHEGPLVETLNPRLSKVDGHWLWSAATETPLIHYTQTDEALYAFCLAWPGRELALTQPVPGPRTEVRLLGHPQPLRWQAAAKGLAIEVPPLSVAELPCRHVWVFKFTGIEDAG